MTPLLCKAARAFLNWTQSKLGEVSGTTLHIVNSFETGRRPTSSAYVAKMQGALLGAGIQFIQENGDGVGVGMPNSSWPARCRAGRSLLGWTHFDVAQAAGVAEDTVMRFEAERLTFLRSTLQVICGALKYGGIIFVEDGECNGVRLRRKG
jgi:transcriptional regulator with XRE-family HTH domain